MVEFITGRQLSLQSQTSSIPPIEIKHFILSCLKIKLNLAQTLRRRLQLHKSNDFKKTHKTQSVHHGRFQCLELAAMNGYGCAVEFSGIHSGLEW